MDISSQCDYFDVLNGLSTLAEAIIQHSLRLVLNPDDYRSICQSMTIFALGKLGAAELNYSSDVDLVFVSANSEDTDMNIHDFQSLLINCIRKLSHAIEEKTDEGFLYRVDLKLRPWGSSGPLCMAIDATENYYESSSEPWERFAWLRSRVIAGSEAIGNELKQRLRPFIFMRSLSTDDLEKFLQIKNDMSKARKRRGHWNIKVGEGGIRDIEFFAQMLQMVNAAEHVELQKTNTIEVLAGLRSSGVLTESEERELVNSYLFLRRLENRVQMIDERQTHDLPDTRKERLKLARSLRFEGSSNDEIINNFENELFVNQSIAKMYFDRVLPQQS
jgi:glutamate-ammonia-ligase adenylyltransferase